MTRALHRLTQGRLRVWAITHGREARLAAQLVVLVGLFLLASSMDYQDQLDHERQMRADVEQQLAAERAAYGSPRVAFVIDARTPAEAKLRLSEIEGELLAQRYRMRGTK